MLFHKTVFRLFSAGGAVAFWWWRFCFLLQSAVLLQRENRSI